jgi:mycothiol synthase
MAHIDGDRAVLRAFVHPLDARREAEILGDLMRAMQTKRLFEHGWLRIERVLRTETVGLSAETVAAYRQLGFAYFYTEHEMHRDLHEPLPSAVMPDGVGIEPWTPERDEAIRETHNESFRERGFAGFDEDDWAGASFSAQDGFRPDLSFLALDGELLAGFCLCEDAAEPDAGRIDTVGMRPAYRGRGIASAMIVRAMQAMREAGLERAALRVNEDNGRARRLYDRLGFVPVKKHVVYRKQIG